MWPVHNCGCSNGSQLPVYQYWRQPRKVSKIGCEKVIVVQAVGARRDSAKKMDKYSPAHAGGIFGTIPAVEVISEVNRSLSTVDTLRRRCGVS